MSWLRRVRNRISPIQMKSGSAVRVQLDDEPQIVTAIASPAGRELNSCMPIQATPDSVKPIQTPLPRIRNSETISSAVIVRSLIAQRLRGGLQHARATQLEDELIDEGDGEHQRTERHRQLRQPERRRIVAGRDVVEGVRLPGELGAVERRKRGEQRGGEQRPDLERASCAAGE